MPLYFFDIKTGDINSSSVSDGVDLPDDAFATAYASGIVSTFQSAQPDEETGRVIIRDETGAIVKIVTADHPTSQ